MLLSLLDSQNYYSDCTCKMNTMNVLKSQFKKFPLIVKIKRRIWSSLRGIRDSTTLNILATFPLYLPYSAGTYRDRASLTIQAINQLFPFLGALSKSVNGNVLAIEDITNFPQTEPEKLAVAKLKERLDFYGSDKADRHNYHYLYGAILSEPAKVRNIFEIGLGTNYADVVSNMGVTGKPGASLRAFRDYCPSASIYGADIDKRILFEEERIKTYYVDQTNPATFDKLLPELPRSFDLVIDDGLHSPNANVESLRFGLGIVRQGGWVVIEDIGSEAACIWQVVAALLPSRYRSYLFNADGGVVFAVKRLE